MYLLLDDSPSLSISFLIDLLISLKIKINNRNSKKIFEINRYCKFFSLSSMKPRSINVKKVKKPTISVIVDRTIM